MANQRPEDILARKLAHEGALARSHIPLDFQPWEREFRALQSAPSGYVMAMAATQDQTDMGIEFRDAEPDALDAESVTTPRPSVEFKAEPTPSGGVLFSPLGIMVGDEPQEIPPDWKRGKRNTAPAATPDDSAVPTSSAATPARKQEQVAQRNETVQRQDRSQTLYNLSAIAARDGHVGNFRPVAGWGSVIAQQAEIDRKRKEDEFAIKTARQQLEARIAKLEAEIAAIDKRLGEIEVRQKEIKRDLQVTAQLRALKEKGVQADDPRVTDLLRDGGYSVQDYQQDDFADRTRARDADNKREAGSLRDEAEDLLRQREPKAKQLEAAKLKLKQDFGEPNEPATTSNATAVHSTEDAQSTALAASLTQDRDIKQRAAASVASGEAADVKAESTSYNRATAAANEITDIAKASVDGFDFDAPPPEQHASVASAIEQTPIKPDVELKPAFTAATLAANDVQDTPEQKNGPAPQAQAATVKPA